MKKVTFKKLVVEAESIRNLSTVQLEAVAGGLKGPPVNTTHSITSACIPQIPTTNLPDPGTVRPQR